MNSTTFDGNITRDPELRTTPNGTQVLGFTVANNCGFGERKSVNWMNCSIWGNRAESSQDLLKKGTSVVITGELTSREYERKDGGVGMSLDVRVYDWSFGRGTPRDTEAEAGAVAQDPDDVPF